MTTEFTEVGVIAPSPIVSDPVVVIGEPAIVTPCVPLAATEVTVPVFVAVIVSVLVVLFVVSEMPVPDATVSAVVAELTVMVVWPETTMDEKRF